MKTPLLILPLFAMSFLNILSSCGTSKNAPKPPPFFEKNGEAYYLQYVALYEDIEPTANGDFYHKYRIIRGDVPKLYYVSSSILHIIPENGIYRIEAKLLTSYSTGKKVKGRGYEAWGLKEFRFVGYSTDENLLQAKVLEYYLENKEKTEYDFNSERFDDIRDIIDKNSFQRISQHYYKDKNYVYYRFTHDDKDDDNFYGSPFHRVDFPHETADPETFEVYKEGTYARDKNNVYFEHYRVGANPETFTPLSDCYGKDDKRVFFRDYSIWNWTGKNADLQSFKVGGIGNFAYDKHFLYYLNGFNNSFHIEIDIETFVIEEIKYPVNKCRDKNYIYRFGYDSAGKTFMTKEKIKLQ
jgi:hypothetical protein